MALDAGYRTGFVQLFHRNRLVSSHVSREIKRIDAEKPDLVLVSLFVDRLDGTKSVTKSVRLLNSVMERQLKGGRQLLIDVKRCENNVDNPDRVHVLLIHETAMSVTESGVMVSM